MMGLLQRNLCGVLAGAVPAASSAHLTWWHVAGVGPLAEQPALLLQGQFLQQAATTIGLPDLSPGAAPSSLLAPSSPLVPHQQLVVSTPLIAVCPSSSFGKP